jgi:bis(5'-nucleosyl)-tetraphosphatase (symmetrical)
MTTFIIGDVHGCFNELKELFHVIDFSPEKDTAIFVGDLVGRGPQPEEVLDFVIGLGKAAVHVLGNYDIRLLGALYGFIQNNPSDNFTPVLESPNKPMYMEWLSQSKLLYFSPELKLIVTHAGIPPQWTEAMALNYSDYFEAYKTRKGLPKTLNILLEAPCLIWAANMSPEDILRYTVFGFTKMKYCHPNGDFDPIYQCAPGLQPSTLIPWFTLRNQKHNDHNVLIFGHWAALGLFQSNSLICCDTGCVWGGKLTAIQGVKDLKVFQVQSAFDANSTNSFHKHQSIKNKGQRV